MPKLLSLVSGYNDSTTAAQGRVHPLIVSSGWQAFIDQEVLWRQAVCPSLFTTLMFGFRKHETEIQLVPRIGIHPPDNPDLDSANTICNGGIITPWQAREQLGSLGRRMYDTYTAAWKPIIRTSLAAPFGRFHFYTGSHWMGERFDADALDRTVMPVLRAGCREFGIDTLGACDFRLDQNHSHKLAKRLRDRWKCRVGMEPTERKIPGINEWHAAKENYIFISTHSRMQTALTYPNEWYGPAGDGREHWVLLDGNIAGDQRVTLTQSYFALNINVILEFGGLPAGAGPTLQTSAIASQTVSDPDPGGGSGH